MLGGLLDHPVEREFRKTAFFFRIAAADIGVHAGEPDLLDVLSDSRRVFVKRIGDEVLRLLPPVEPERATALVDRHGVAKDFNTGIPESVRPVLECGDGETPLRPRTL